MEDLPIQTSAFQETARRDVIRTLHERDIFDIVQRRCVSEVGGRAIVDLIIRFADIDIWLYEDGANILGGTTDRRFEIYDYDDLDALAADLFTHVREIAAQGR